MKRMVLLREYLRTSRRVHLQPTMDGLKKVEYLRFIGANLCPACEEEVDPEKYLCIRNPEGTVVERYVCSSCGTDFSFPVDAIH